MQLSLDTIPALVWLFDLDGLRISIAHSVYLVHPSWKSKHMLATVEVFIIR